MFFAGLAQGFSQAQELDRQQQMQVDEANAQREQSTLLHLATTHPDPEVRSSALATMLTPRTKSPSAMGRFFSDARSNPAMPTLMQLMGSQKQVPVMGQPPPPPETAGGQPLERDVAPSLPVQTGTQMVSRGAPPTSAQVAGQTTYEQGRASVLGPTSAINEVMASAPPGAAPNMVLNGQGVPTDEREIMKQEIAYRAMKLPEARVVDGQGNVRVMFGGNVTRILPAAGRMSAPEQRVSTEAANLDAAGRAATAPPGTPVSSVDQARAAEAGATTAKQQTAVSGATTAAGRATITTVNAENAPAMAAARLAASQTTTAVGEAREKLMAAQTFRAWQTANGTTPPSISQRVTMARELAGGDPEVTSRMVAHLADAFAGGGAGGGGGAAPKAKAADQPPGTQPTVPKGKPATPGAGSVSSAVEGAGMGDIKPKSMPYSPQGKRTVQAVNTMQPMLQALVDDIKTAKLQNDGNAVGTGWSNMLQRHGFSPGALQTEMLQLASVAEANGFSTMTVGRLNMPMVEILKGHLTDAGDSYKVLYDKANGMLAKLPAILKAVDTAENMRTGGGGGQGTKPAAAATTPPGATIRARDAQGKLHEAPRGTPLPAGWTAE